MNPATPDPHVADDVPASPLARRVGPPIAVAALVLTTALLAWLALSPTTVTGRVQDGPFVVPATLVLPPDDDGCLRVVDGDGSEREHCIDELAQTGDGYRYAEAFFDSRGRLVVARDAGDGDQITLEVDPVTGEVLGPVDLTEPAPGEVEPPPQEMDVMVDGDRVVLWQDDGGDAPPEDVLLDLKAPPGYELQSAVRSPDHEWVVALTPDGEVVVAPTDGSAAPRVWAEPVQGWVDPWRAIRWDD